MLCANRDRLAAALTIAGSDSGGGAGIQADLKVFQRFGVFGASAITAVTAQNTRGVRSFLCLPEKIVAEQIDAVMEDIRPQAVKTGMLGNAALTRLVARKAREHRIGKLVVDPVMISTSRHRLLASSAVGVLIRELLPLALVATPNLDEASVLAGFPVRTREEMRAAAEAIRKLGAAFVVVKGGHRRGDADDLLYDGKRMAFLPAARSRSGPIHGAGCSYAAAIAAGLARGMDPAAAVRAAKRFISEVLKKPLRPGRGAYTIDYLGLLPKNWGRSPR